MPKYRITFVLESIVEAKNEEQAISYFQQHYSQLDEWDLISADKLKVEEI